MDRRTPSQPTAPKRRSTSRGMRCRRPWRRRSHESVRSANRRRVSKLADFLYDIYRINIMGEDTHTYVDVDDDTLGVYFVDEGTDTPNQTTDQDCADRTGNNPTFANAPNLANTVVTATAN